MAGGVRIDLSQWPVVVFHCEGLMTEESINVHLKEYRQLLDRGEPYVVLMDARRIEAGPTSLRKIYAAFLADNAADLKRLCRMCVFVTNSRLVTAAISAVLWLVPLPFPYKATASYDDGLRWLRSLI